MKSYRYLLRYYIDPGFHEEERIKELLGFCFDAQIDEVVLFMEPEEMFQGFPTEENTTTWITLGKRIKTLLNRNGIALGFNPWISTGQITRGRNVTGIGASFQKMVGENGVVSELCACPLCDKWQCYIANYYARIAKEVNPVDLWIEDDWRLHNHDNLGYGGCFCPLHLRRFATEIGKDCVTRDELLSEILDPKNNLQWRNAWLKVNRESLLEPAVFLEKKIHAANQHVRIALMSSRPDIHSVEGRDWNALKNAFSPGCPMLLRPHMSPYTECYALHVFPATTRQTVAEFAPESIEVVPELENSPRSGTYSKSAAFSAWECLTTPLYGSAGVTINHFDMMGNGIALDRKFGTKLRKIKPRLNALSQLGLTETGAEGVDVLFSAEIAGFIKATSKSSCKGLINNSIGWSLTLGTLGISHRLTARYDNSRLTAVSDQTLRAFSDEDIKKMLSGKLLCDAMSAAILFERGFGEYCGFSQCEWRSQELDGYAYETIESENLNVYPHTYPRMSTQRCGQRLLKMTPLKNAEIKSTIRHYERSFLYPGMIRYKNNLGGEVILIAYELCKDQFFMSFFNEFRRIFLQHTIKEVAPELPIAFGLKHPLHVYRNRMPDGSTLLSIVNPTHDELSEVTFEINYANLTKTSMLQPDGVWRNMNIASQMVVYKLSPLEAIYIKIQQLKDEYK